VMGEETLAEASSPAYKDVVIPSKDGKLIETSDEIPTGGDVSSNEDANREDGERVHVL
jgi:hypothetical protein